MMLIHYYSRHVMEKIITPGEVKISPQTIIDGRVHAGLDVALGDLRSWHTLRAWCTKCSHHAMVRPRRADPAVRQGSPVQLGRTGAFLHELRSGRAGSARGPQHATKLRVRTDPLRPGLHSSDAVVGAWISQVV